MPQPWEPEVRVDAERARGLIAGQFPELADAEVRELGAGWDNTVFLVDGRWAFRFPRREVAVPLLEREIQILPRLAPNLPLPVPEPRWIGAPTDGFGWPWVGATFLPGVELAQSGLPDDRRDAVAVTVGTFLRALHAPRLRSRVGPLLPHDPNRRSDMAFRVAATRRRLEELAADEIWQAPAEIHALLADAERLPPSPHSAVLHGDLHGHVLVDEMGAVTGVIDWGDVCVGDPAIDLQFAYSTLVGPARAALLDAYGQRVDGLTELRARVIATFLSAALLLYAVDQGLDALRDESVRGLERAVS